MPSFDVVSELDMHEVGNAVDQASREVNTRFDFKNTGSTFEREEGVVTMSTESDFQLKQMLDILQTKLHKRGVDLRCLQVEDAELVGQVARQRVILREGIDPDQARDIVKLIKQQKLKVQAAIQGSQVRVTGKKRDNLQQVISLLKEEKVDLPLQFQNFRD